MISQGTIYHYNKTENVDIDAKLEEVVLNNNFDILIKTGDNKMAVTYKLSGIYKITPEASIFLANQMWLGKEQYGVTPGTVVIEPTRMLFKKLGMTLGILDYRVTHLFASDGVLYYMGTVEPPLCKQAQIWAIELNNA